MAKKKKVEMDEDDDLDDFGVDDFDVALPTLAPKKEPKKKVKAEPIEEDFGLAGEESEDLSLDLIEEIEVIDYKYVKPDIIKGTAENDYELTLKGQSHGLCNIFVKILLETKGVVIAAYKVTGLEPAKIFIRLEKGHKIKDILYKAIESLREKVEEVQKLFQKII